MSTATISATIAVEPADRRTWQRLLIAAVAKGLRCDIAEQGGNRDLYWLNCRVASFTSARVFHDVRVTFRGLGMPTNATVTCDCKAAEFGTKCTHAALAIDQCSAWPDGMLIVLEPGSEGNDERYEYTVTDRVQVIGTERTGVVDRICVIDNRPAYRVTDPEAHQTLGIFLSYELTPAAARRINAPAVDRSAGMAMLMGGTR